ncbi:MAG: DoxX family protein [Gemmatimonadetes bacterium]|nr:DoxX family protein [Gemmatimonadota bacterium]NIS01389.1 DoxX family protein [Gemmatimonadota bacterium]NIT66579.1 DoxX family protein [Gemmatimonadota bacterium]NIU52024.1 DoxX family membrane protein [Gemmatimonadota bacterium]NIV23112.1 DoxX family membrane protein [Gemmatimonadota bacterium]
MSRKPETGLLVLRVAMGIIFLLHGSMKLFGGRESFVREMLAMVGWDMPNVLLTLVAIVETLGGLALMLGLFARLAGLVLAVEMVVAVALFHLGQGFFIVAIPNVPLAYGFEYHVALVGGLICIALGGPGAGALQEKIRSPSASASMPGGSVEGGRPETGP